MNKNNVLKVVPVLEDSVECFFFSSVLTADKSYWVNLCQKLNRTIQTLTDNYIWHKEDFKVYFPISEDCKDEVPYHLASTTCFGDNIEDEWFIVHLVLQLSKQYKDLIIQIRDNDGEFLLIEAADFLPAWANPDSTENRVFIHQNKLHIIPPSAKDLQTKIDLEDAIKIIAHISDKTEACSEIQQSILNRIGKYPDKIGKSLHRTTAKLPVDIATLLTLKPTFIAHLVNAYCNHDVVDAKACKTMVYDDSILFNVKLTKCLYAMLMHAEPLNYLKMKEVDKKLAIGQKLTVGYQILTNKPTSDNFSTKQFKNFISKLTASGYFKDNIEGSNDYKELLKNAKEFYSVIECPINSQVSREITELATSSKFVQTKKTLLENSLSSEDFVEDSEEWLNINPEQLNDMLNSRYGKKAKFNNDDGALTAHNVTSKLSSFLMQTSDFEGIETNKAEDTENIEFDPDDFANSVEKMLHLITTTETEIEASESDEDNYEYDENGDDTTEVDEELNGIKQDGLQDSNTILYNIMQSMKEEGISGPSSNLMTTIGFNKSEFLDSDDDE